MFRNLSLAGAPYGIEFGKMSLLSNSRLALEAGEFARDQERHDEFHERVFKAYFKETRDIGRIEVILDLAEDAGLAPDELKKNLAEGRYKARLDAAADKARRLGVNAIPAFIINQGESRIVGAQPLSVFQKALRQAKSL